MEIDDDLLFMEHIGIFKNNVEDFYQKENNTNKTYNDIVIPKPSKLMISVMSATCYLGNIINLHIFCNKLQKNDNIVDINPSHQITRKSNTKNKIFYNQTTLHIRPWFNDKNKYNLDILVNLKLFRNGKCQMCGLRSKKDGIQTIKILLQNLNLNKECIGNESDKSIYNIEQIVENFNITLINSDFDIGYKIDRKKLFDILLDKYELFVTFDPCHYQGVNLKYFINYENNKENTGKCLCNIIDKNICKGKGEGNGNLDCKKMTISIFQSGNIIITGKCDLKQLDESYKFIINICNENFNEIYQPLLSNDTRKIKRRSIRILEKKINN